MKKINEMTEQEILNLSEEEIQKMIKLRLAEEGIKIMDVPKVPELFEITPPDTIVYQIIALGDNLSFEDINEANAILDLLSKSKSLGFTDYSWDKLGSDFKYFEKGKTRKWNNNGGIELKSEKAYSMKLYAEITDVAIQNKKMREHAEKELKEYNEINSQCSDIVSEIRDRISEVNSKYERLNSLVYKFTNDYLPLADNNSEIAIKFMTKAYSLSENDIEYVNSKCNE